MSQIEDLRGRFHVDDYRAAVIERASELVVVAEHHGPGDHLESGIQHLRLAIENLVWAEYKALHANRFAESQHQ